MGMSVHVPTILMGSHLMAFRQFYHVLSTHREIEQPTWDVKKSEISQNCSVGIQPEWISMVYKTRIWNSCMADNINHLKISKVSAVLF